MNFFKKAIIFFRVIRNYNQFQPKIKSRKKLSKFMIIPFDISKNGSEIIFNNE